MARPLRCVVPGAVYHVVNRGNEKHVVFHEDADYEHFIGLLVRGRQRAEVDIHGFCLMSTHFHLLVRPLSTTALSEYMHWVAGCYACHLRAITGTVGLGHVFQRRYFSAAIDDHLGWLTVLGYIEQNPREAQVVQRAEEWRWSSLFDRTNPRDGLITPGFIDLPDSWVEMVNLPWREFLDALVAYDLERRQQERMRRSCTS